MDYDYESIHGPGISNFSSSPHRMPTVSAAQALKDLAASPRRCISLALDHFDCLLQNREPGTGDEASASIPGGISRGKVTEIYGPPGVGKTALGMQLAASALHANEGVIWVDASHPLPGPRFTKILKSYHPKSEPPQEHPTSFPDILNNLTHFSTPSLAHLIALLTHPSPESIPSNTALLIIDSFSTLVSTAFPRPTDAATSEKKPKTPKPSSRKIPILQYLINSLQKLAATRNMAIVVLSQCVTKMRPGAGAVLVPAISATAWEQGLGCRVSLYRDWSKNEDGYSVDNIRVAQVLKADGVSTANGKVKLVGFSPVENGLEEIFLPSLVSVQAQPLATSTNNLAQEISLPLLSLKRKLAATDFEIPDSENEDDEDYGWAEADVEDMPPMPPQWQGSEDILIPPQGEMIDGESEDELEILEEKSNRRDERALEYSQDELA